MSEITCDNNPTNPNCTCPEWGSKVGMKKVTINAGEFGPNNPPNTRYFCSYSTSGCRGKPTDHPSCGCNTNPTYKDCNCKTGNKFLIPYGMYAHYRRDNIYCCGDQSGAFDNICRQTGWNPSTLEHILPSKEATTTAAPSAIISSTEEGKSFLAGSSIDLESGKVTDQVETARGIEPAQIINRDIAIPTGVTITPNKSPPESTVAPTSTVLSNNGGTLAISTEPDNAIVVSGLSGSTAMKPITKTISKTVDENMFDTTTLIIAVISGLLLFFLAGFLFWKYT